LSTHIRALVDATAVPDDLGGVGRYVTGFVESFRSRSVELHVVVKPGPQADWFEAHAPHAIVHRAPAALRRTAVRLAWEQLGLPLLARRLRVDVIHSPHYTLPLLSRRRRVVTLHDATFFSDPHWHIPTKARFFRLWTRLALRLADAVITPSQATADELERLVGRTPRLLQVAPLGVDRAIFREPTGAEVDRMRDDLGLGDEPYVAFLGTIEPRKNVPALIQAVSRFSTERVARGERPWTLVVAGAKGWDSETDGAVAAAPSLQRVVVPGYLPLEQLAAYLGGSECVAYPSLGEGFGLPVIEALACGAPVVTTERLSLAEVGGDAVEYTGVSASEIAATLERVAAPGVDRAARRSRGLARAAEFTWTRCAAVHDDVYQAAAKGAP
jgi:glycosyltransferase involved in cell wall biosynthesis